MTIYKSTEAGRDTLASLSPWRIHRDQLNISPANHTARGGRVSGQADFRLNNFLQLEWAFPGSDVTGNYSCDVTYKQCYWPVTCVDGKWLGHAGVSVSLAGSHL